MAEQIQNPELLETLSSAEAIRKILDAHATEIYDANQQPVTEGQVRLISFGQNFFHAAERKDAETGETYYFATGVAYETGKDFGAAAYDWEIRPTQGKSLVKKIVPGEESSAAFIPMSPVDHAHLKSNLKSNYIEGKKNGWIGTPEQPRRARVNRALGKLGIGRRK